MKNTMAMGQAIAAQTFCTSAYNHRGVALARKGDYDRALVEYNAALRLNPNDADVYNNRGVSFEEKGDLDRAIADYSEALRLNSKYAFAYNNRGVAWKNKGEYDLAIADYSEAIRLNPKYVNPLANRAFAYEKKGKLYEALADFRSALDIDSSRRELNQDVRRLEQSLLRPAATEAAIGPEPAGSKSAKTSWAAQGERRVALVIGNGTYKNAPLLPNPRNDAVDMAAILRKLGFDVIDGHDLDRRDMENKIREFSRKIENADLALFYYAGHGLQVTGKNYLVPIDAKLEREGDLSFEAIDVDVVLQPLENGPRANLVFLDACRNNPLARNFARSLGIRSAAVGMGLASIQGGIGTMILYATQPNNVALDGDGRNSPFTGALLAHLPNPGVDISIVLRRVRADVIRATNQKQVPWDHSSLVGELVLARQ
jgi:lipoprotein NlpI